MLRRSQQTPLKIGLLDISPHNRAILEFFFAGAGKKFFEIVNEKLADVFIIDFDHPGAQNNWEMTYSTRGKPCIVLSIQKVELPLVIWVSKPLTTAALSNAAKEAKKNLGNSKNDQDNASNKKEPSIKVSTNKMRFLVGGRKIRFPFYRPKMRKYTAKNTTPPKKFKQPKKNLISEKSESTAFPADNTAQVITNEKDVVVEPLSTASSERKSSKIKTKKKSTPTVAEKNRWIQLCGVHNNIANEKKWQLEAVLYTPENYLQATLLDAKRMSEKSQQMVKVSFSPHIIFIYPTAQQIYCNLHIHKEEFFEICNNPIRVGQANMELLDLPDETEMIEKYFSDTTLEFLYDLESFIWTLSLLTSSGRLHREVHVHQKIALKHWPNFTRLELFPHAMKIAALWARKSGNLFEIATILNIPQRYVFSFYNAANALELIEYNKEKLKTKQSKESKSQKKHRGLFSRLFRRLLGGIGK